MRTTISIGLIIALASPFYSCNANTELSKNAVIDSIVVKKDKREMYVFQKNTLLKTYKIALGLQPKGAKHYQGDMCTPEGLYFIKDKNPNSAYHKNLGISYPSNADKAFAARIGKATGGDVKIHGLPNGRGYIGSLHRVNDWTHGCIAVTNEEIDELFIGFFNLFL